MKKAIYYILFFTIIISGIASCNNSGESLKSVIIRGNIFGTIYSVTYYSTDGENLKEEIDSIFNDFNNSLSYYNPNSLISRINRNETSTPDDYFLRVYNRSSEISKETNGDFDVTVSPLVNIWGFGFENKAEVTKYKIDSILDFVGYQKARIKDGKLVKDDERISFDFNAIAKGYAADVIGEFLLSRGIEIFLVEIGGDLVAKGLKPGNKKWKIGIEKPAQNYDDPQDWQYLIEIHDQAVATSGNYRRYYEEDGLRYSHTIDPHTGYPVKHNLLSATVIADDALTADAFATAFMVMGLEEAIEFTKSKDNIEAFFIYSAGEDVLETYTSKGIEIINRNDL